MSPSASVTMLTPANVRRLKRPAVSSWSRLKRSSASARTTSTFFCERLAPSSPGSRAACIVAPETAWSEVLAPRCASPGAARTRGRCGTGQRSRRRAGSRTSSGRRWRLSFAVLFDRTIRLRDGLVEDFTRGLSCQQSDEREHCLVGLRIDMRPAYACDERHRSFALAFELAASTRDRSSSTHDNPALTSNDELLLLNQLEAGRSVLRTERPSARGRCGLCGRASCRRA